MGKVFIKTFFKLLVVLGVVFVLQNEPPRQASANHSEKPKPAVTTSTITKVEPPVAPAPTATPPISTPPPSCAEEIKKYGWNQSVAYNVMMVESKGNYTILNNNPRTGDYSVGCFQINLMGGNLLSKYRVATTLGYTGSATVAELEPWLKNATNNVAVAHKLWLGSGWQPWSFTTCKKVACY